MSWGWLVSRGWLISRGWSGECTGDVAGEREGCCSFSVTALGMRLGDWVWRTESEGDALPVSSIFIFIIT